MKVKRQSGQAWCDELEISIVGGLTEGFTNFESFESDLITKTEFCCRITHCKLKSNKFQTEGDKCRREASKMRNFLSEK